MTFAEAVALFTAQLRANPAAPRPPCQLAVTATRTPTATITPTRVPANTHIRTARMGTATIMGTTTTKVTTTGTGTITDPVGIPMGPAATSTTLACAASSKS